MSFNGMTRAVLAAVLLAVLCGASQLEASEREGEVVPFFKFRDTAGTAFDLKEVTRESKAVLIFFWHSYKTMSIREMNFLNNMNRYYNLYGLEILGIEGGGREREGVIEELEKLAVIGTEPSFSIGADPGGKLARQYRVKEIPETFIIGRGGKILYHLRGFREGDRDALEEHIKEILGLQPAPKSIKSDGTAPGRKDPSPRKTTVSVDPIQQQMEKCSYFGRYYLNLDELDKALGYYEQCLAVKPDDVSTLLQIGEVYARRKDYERAREAWESILKIEPGNEEAAALIRRLVRGEF